jgi:hypothetical protein
MGRGVSDRTRAIAQLAAEIIEAEGRRTKRGLGYKMLGKLITSMDEIDAVERAVDWGIANLIVDPDGILEAGRAEEVNSTLESLAEVREQLALWDYGCFWPEQPRRILVWYEKAAIRSIVKPVCDEFFVPSLSARGDNSDTQLRLLLKAVYRNPRQKIPYIIGYAGDHDAPGVRMDGHVVFDHEQGDIPNRLREQDDILRRWSVHRDGVELSLPTASSRISVERILVTSDDLDRGDLDPIPVKATHAYHSQYLELFGDRALEVDFLPSAEIAERIRNWIDSKIDWKRWRKSERAGRLLKDDVLRRIA